MVETFTGGFETERNKTAHAPVHVLKMEWPQVGSNPAKTLYLADRPLTIGAQAYLAVVDDWGRLDGLHDPRAFLDTSFSDLNIKLINAPVDYGSGAERFSTLIKRYPLEAATVTLYQWFTDAGLGAGDLAERFKARPEENIEWDDETIGFDLVIISKNYGERIVGGVIEANAYPNAPAASLGTPKPIVIGAVDGAPGIPVRRAAKTRITSVVLTTDTVINVTDASAFPAAGTLLVNDDEVSYAGKNATQFTGVTGLNLIHYDGDEVVLKITDYRFLFSDPDFPIKDLANVRVGGELADTSINPLSKNVGAGEIVFQRPPRRVDAYDTRFFPVEFDAADAQNTSLNPMNAVSRNDFQNVASVNQANPKLSLAQQDALPNRGPINRVLLRIAHNADEKLASDNVTARIRGLGSPFTLSKPAAVDEVNYSGDVDISHETLENLNWAIDNPLHQHTATSQADHIVVQGATSGAGGRVQLSAGNQTLVVQFPPPPEGNPIKTEYRIVLGPTPHQLNFSVGGNPNIKFGNQNIASWNGPRQAFDLTESFQVNSSGGNTWIMSITNGFVVFDVHSIERLLFYPPQPATQDKDLANVKSGAVLPTSGTRAVSGTPTKTTQIHTQFFDITDLVGGSWAWFENKILDIEYNGASDGRTVYIAMAFIEIEFTRRRLSQTDAVTADVEGVKDADGSITGTPGALIERPDHVFAWSILKAAGLTSNEIDSASFNAAGASYAAAIAGGYVFGGIIDGGQRLRDVWDRWVKESRSRFWWDSRGRAVLQYRPLNKGGTLPAPVKTITQSMIRADDSGREQIRFSKTATRNIITRIDLTYKYNAAARDHEGVVSVIDETAAILYGAKGKPEAFDFRFVRADAMAEHLAGFYLEQHKAPSVIVEAEMFLDASELTKGDVIQFEHPTGSYDGVFAEILNVSHRHGSGRDGIMDSVSVIFRLFPESFLEAVESEAVTAVDAVTLLNVYFRSVAESVTAGETARLRHTAPFTDGPVAVSVAVLLTVFGLLLAETVAAGDDVTFTTLMPFSEAGVVTEQVAVTLGDFAGYGSQNYGNTPYGGGEVV